ncbi:hypothetical protein BO71DRAFT_468276 [Aspergillus ellipticus CBS 707.79]|uniref:Uncharacterized protein n=1 Tax=Aspergillus ellipticus CBS 707.79 TaxID=1448320 RepID=A0A319DBK7_9EURO|nr:hypothetical protein BO71DRAFT_468276 [Aspergillus ellipticus CBS 707.79]
MKVLPCLFGPLFAITSGASALSFRSFDTGTSQLAVATTSGSVHGFVNSTAPNVRQFRGIPFAQPPVGLVEPSREDEIHVSPASCRYCLSLTGSSSVRNDFNSSTDQLWVGLANVDITPEINPNWLPLNEFELEKLHVRAIVFENNGERGALISVEIANYEQLVYEHMIGMVAGWLNVSQANVLFSATHTHGAAPWGSGLFWTAHNYGNQAVNIYPTLGDATLKAVKEAYAKMVPAKVGYATGEAYLNVNRDNMNPLTGRWTQFSNLTDWPGAMCRWIEQSFGDDVVALYSQSASGDMNPRCRRTGTNTLASIAHMPIPGLEMAQEPIEEPIRNFYIPLERPDVAYVPQLFSELTAGGIVLGEEVIRIISTTTEWDSNPTVWTKQANVTCPGRSRMDNAREGVPGYYVNGTDIAIMTGVMGLGDLVLAHVGAEIFTRIGWNIYDNSVMNKTMLVTMCNGVSTSGYIADVDSVSQEVFQTLGSNLYPGACAQQSIVSSTSGYIQEYKASL